VHEINFTSIRTGEKGKLDLDTATLTQLKDVKEPGKLPQADKMRYFERKQGCEKQERLDVVDLHRIRMQRVMEGLQKRAVGPEDDEVHKALKSKATELDAMLGRWKSLAEQDNPKGFKELTLVNDLRGPLKGLISSLPEDMSGSQEHVTGLKRARNQVGDGLAHAESGVRAWVQGARISYRGSLATGWRNAKKSAGEEGQKVAQRINLLQFDADAFVEIPAAIWKDWVTLDIVLQNKAKDKMPLSELMVRARAAKDKPGLETDEKKKRERAFDQLSGIVKVEEQLRLAMGSVKGYKKEKEEGVANHTADFSFVLQSSEKTTRELTSGNLYPLAEVEKAGLPLTESNLDVVYEDGVFNVKMPEHHMRMTDPVPTKTYDWVPDSDPHTKDRPTVAMVMKNYFEAPTPLKHVTTNVTGLVKQMEILGISDEL
jgi:hypothetical protein